MTIMGAEILWVYIRYSIKSSFIIRSLFCLNKLSEKLINNLINGTFLSIFIFKNYGLARSYLEISILGRIESAHWSFKWSFGPSWVRSVNMRNIGWVYEAHRLASKSQVLHISLGKLKGLIDLVEMNYLLEYQ